MSTSRRILDNAQYHSELLRTQEDLQYAPSALTQQTKYLEELKTELEKAKKNVARLAEITKKERKEHEILRDSTTRRLAHRLAGKKEKFEAKKEKEEREYVEALETEMRERGNQTMLEVMVQDATQVKADLTEKTQRLKIVKDELGHLYEAIFDGHTPEFPRDDQLEQQMTSAQESYERIQGQVNSNSQAVGLLRQADDIMEIVMKNMDEALSYSTWDIYGGGTLSDVLERNALSNAAMAAGKAEILIQQARRSSPQIQNIGSLRAHEISLLGDVFFDNFFSDYRAHQKIQANREELAKSHRRLRIEYHAARQRAQSLGADLVEASEVLTECRQELERFRKETFQRISSTGVAASGRESDDVLPSYEARSTTVLISSEAGPSSRPSTTAANTTSGRAGPVEQFYPPPLGPPPDSAEASSSRVSEPRAPISAPPIYQVSSGPPPGHSGDLVNLGSVSESHFTSSASGGTNTSSARFSPADNFGSALTLHDLLPALPSTGNSSNYSSASTSSVVSRRNSSRSNYEGSRQSAGSSSLEGASLTVPSHRRAKSTSSAPGQSSSSLAVNKPLPPLSQNDRGSSGIAAGDGDESQHESSVSPSVPVHWGSRNPFAATLISGFTPRGA